MTLYLVEEDEKVIVTRGYYVVADTLDEAIDFVKGNVLDEAWSKDYAGDDDPSYDDSREIGFEEKPDGVRVYDAKSGDSQS